MRKVNKKRNNISERKFKKLIKEKKKNMKKDIKKDSRFSILGDFIKEEIGEENSETEDLEVYDGLPDWILDESEEIISNTGEYYESKEEIKDSFVGDFLIIDGDYCYNKIKDKTYEMKKIDEVSNIYSNPHEKLIIFITKGDNGVIYDEHYGEYHIDDEIARPDYILEEQYGDYFTHEREGHELFLYPAGNASTKREYLMLGYENLEDDEIEEIDSKRGSGKIDHYSLFEINNEIFVGSISRYEDDRSYRLIHLGDVKYDYIYEGEEYEFFVNEMIFLDRSMEILIEDNINFLKKYRDKYKCIDRYIDIEIEEDEEDEEDEE